MKEPEQAPVRSRRRLPAAVRKDQILDAALIEFSGNGFGAARMEDIARRAGISKGGMYAYFASKEEMFEALLTKQLLPAQFVDLYWLMSDEGSVEMRVETFIARIYDGLQNVDALATLRLLIAEGGRVPDLVHRWYEDVIQTFFDEQQAVIDKCINQGILYRSPVTENVQLIFSPVIHVTIIKITLGEQIAAEKISALLNAYKQELINQLKKPSDSSNNAA